MDENWDPEPEEQDPASTSDEAIIDIEGDDDSNDLGLIDPNAPDEMLDDDRSVNEAPPDDQSDGEPEQFVGREWDLPERQTRSGRGFIVRTILRNNESYLVELSLSVAALAADFAYIMSMADPDTMTLKEALKQPDAEEFLMNPSYSFLIIYVDELACLHRPHHWVKHSIRTLYGGDDAVDTPSIRLHKLQQHWPCLQDLR